MRTAVAAGGAEDLPMASKSLDHAHMKQTVISSGLVTKVTSESSLRITLFLFASMTAYRTDGVWAWPFLWSNFGNLL